MLEDFIEANNLKARIVSGKPSEFRIKCLLYICGSDSFLLASPAEKHPDLQKIKNAVSAKDIEVPDAKTILETTGYEKDFLPPVSIFGITLLLDKSIAEKEKLQCAVSDSEYLEISGKEILESSEEALIGDYCR